MKQEILEDPWESFFESQDRLNNLPKNVSSLELLEIVISAEAPVPEQHRNDSKEKSTLARMTKTQKLGCVIYLSRRCQDHKPVQKWLRSLTKDDKEDPIILEKGLQIADDLEKDRRLRGSFVHALLFFMSSRYSDTQRRNFRRNRIRGYRDKGTLPDQHLRALIRANQEDWMDVRDFRIETQDFLKENLPPYVFEGDSISLSEALLFLQEEKEIQERLEKILIQA